MKTWKEAPHLFANGKFTVKVVRSGGSYIEDDPKKILWQANMKFGDNKLIARPISDMSDEEINALYKDNNNFSIEQRRTILKNQIQHESLYFTNVQYLLSIGVYPFDQSHFETGEVISK